MATLWAQTTEYDIISVDDDLPILVKFEFRPPAQIDAEAPTEQPVDTKKLTAYVKELLLKAFPPDVVNSEETTIETEILIDFLPGDTVSVCGRVAGKSDVAGKRAVECQVTVETHEGETVATARAMVSL
jgi:hypothetical protein